jgi:hypothetical protein
MNGLRAWQIASTTKMHFTSDSYNAPRFNFKARHLTAAKFEHRKDRWIFDNLARRLDEESMKSYAFANQFFRQSSWAGDMQDEVYAEYCKRLQTFGYRLKEDLKKLSPSATLDEFLRPQNGLMPPLVGLYLQGELMAETVIAIHCVTNFINVIDPMVTESIIWPDTSKRILKAVPFVGPNINQKKAKKILLDFFKERE